MRCDICLTTIIDRHCPQCELYNAAVVASQTAALHIAQRRNPSARKAWLNSTGIYAHVGNGSREVIAQLGSAEEAAPFLAMITGARNVRSFFVHSTEPVRWIWPSRLARVAHLVKHDTGRDTVATPCGQLPVYMRAEGDVRRCIVCVRWVDAHNGEGVAA